MIFANKKGALIYLVFKQNNKKRELKTFIKTNLLLKFLFSENTHTIWYAAFCDYNQFYNPALSAKLFDVMSNFKVFNFI
jgi:hypothetical protein